MPTAVKGYYNGKQIVMDEDVKLAAGQKVIVTIFGKEIVNEYQNAERIMCSAWFFFNRMEDCKLLRRLL